MAVKLLPIWTGVQFFNAAGQVLSGGKIFSYLAGTTTPATTYTDATGGTPNGNPIVLDSAGRYSAQLWATTGATYKLVLQDSVGTVILTEDNLSPVNDVVAGGSQSEWVTSNLTPTYSSGGNTFTVPGVQTSIFTVGRRIQVVDSGTTYYATVTSSSGTGPTTVVVAMDSGVLDGGLTVVNYALLGETNPSVPASIAYPLTLTKATISQVGGTPLTTTGAVVMNAPTSGATLSVTGNVVVSPPGSGVALAVTGINGSDLADFTIPGGNGTNAIVTIRNSAGTGISAALNLIASSAAGNINLINNGVMGLNAGGIISINDAVVRFPGITTTASAANAFLDNAAQNSLLRSTSSIRYKTEVCDLVPDDSEIIPRLRPISFRSKIETDDQTKRHLGFIAEEVALVDPRLIHWTKDGDGKDIPDGVQYERITVLLVEEIHKLRAEIESLKLKVQS